ncbi:hypothetical protein JCM15060_21300 [Halanaerobaculum tunisiense]
MVIFDAQQSIIYNGGKLKSFIRFRNKELDKLQQKISKCQKYSKHWNKLNRGKQKLLLKSKNKIMDVLKKYTSHLVSYSIKQNVSTIVIGDIQGIRENIFSAKGNQKLLLLKHVLYTVKNINHKIETITVLNVILNTTGTELDLLISLKSIQSVL